MKKEAQVHMLPTEARTYLFTDILSNLGFNLHWDKIPQGRTNQHLYFTTDEEIKELPK